MSTPVSFIIARDGPYLRTSPINLSYYVRNCPAIHEQPTRGYFDNDGLGMCHTPSYTYYIYISAYTRPLIILFGSILILVLLLQDIEGLEKLQYETLFNFQDPHIVGVAFKCIELTDDSGKKRRNRRSISS